MLAFLLAGCSLSPLPSAHPNIPDESPGISGIVRTLLAVFDQADVVALGEDHESKGDSDVRIAQLLATRPETALELAKGFVRAKVAGQLGNLDLWPDSPASGYVEHKLLSHLEAIETAQDTAALLTLEASAALSYFKLWQELPLNWSSKSATRIPPDWFAVEQRQIQGQRREPERESSYERNPELWLCRSRITGTNSVRNAWLRYERFLP
jgi:hypothetical protein